MRPDGSPKDLPVNEITRGHALQFRAWWSARVVKGHKIETANKDFGHLAQIMGTWAKLTDLPVDNPFRGLRLEGKDGGRTPPFSRAWLEERLLAPDALAGLNEEARDVFLMMVNTGLRPSEITDAPLEDFVVDAPIPFFRVAPNGRELKVAHTRREMPVFPSTPLVASSRGRPPGVDLRNSGGPTHNIDDLARGLSDVARRQIPFATSVAINKTLADVKKNEEKNLSRRQDRPTPFTLRAFAVRRSSKRKLTGAAFAKNIRARVSVAPRGRWHPATEGPGHGHPRQYPAEQVWQLDRGPW